MALFEEVQSRDSNQGLSDFTAFLPASLLPRRVLFKSGRFQHQVDDFPVCASKQLSTDKLLLNVIKDYRTNEAKPYTPDALAGFPCEHYSIGLSEAWNGIGSEMDSYLKNQALRQVESKFLMGIQMAMGAPITAPMTTPTMIHS